MYNVRYLNQTTTNHILSESFIVFMFYFAERVGFEPTVPFGTPVFKTGAINHYATSPKLKLKTNLNKPKSQKELTYKILL